MKNFQPIRTIKCGGCGKIIEGIYMGKYPAITKKIIIRDERIAQSLKYLSLSAINFSILTKRRKSLINKAKSFAKKESILMKSLKTNKSNNIAKIYDYDKEKYIIIMKKYEGNINAERIKNLDFY